MRKPLTITRDQRGFTLTELLVACALIGLVMAGLFSMLQSGQQTYLTGTNQVEAQQALRLALLRMTNEIRDAGYCPTCGTGNPAIAGFEAITAQSATTFTIQNDWNGTWDGVGSGIFTGGTVPHVVLNTDGTSTTTNRGEQVIYAFNPGTGSLTRREIGIDAQPVVIASGISSLTFTYLDINGAPTTTAANIRAIVVNVVGQPQNQPTTFQAGRVQVAMTDSIRLRNRTQ
jgi:prepilin-type N-terminal cleavage/methylation domain-containing protein